MEITDRFAQVWERWEEAVREPTDVPAFLARAADEDLIELLAGESRRARKYERDVIATEVLNRLRQRQSSLPAAAAEVLRSAEDAYGAAVDGQRAIHTAEGILKASGEVELGTKVSASAYASLDTTKLAFEAAKQNSSDVMATVAQSRVAHALAASAEAAAREGSRAAHAATERLEESGHGEVARGAREAAAAITDATSATVEAVKTEREVQGDPTRKR